MGRDDDGEHVIQSVDDVPDSAPPKAPCDREYLDGVVGKAC